MTASHVPTGATTADDHVSLETAARHAASQVPVFAPERTAAEVRRQLVDRRYESASQVVVCHREKFVGIVRPEDQAVGVGALRRLVSVPSLPASSPPNAAQ